VSDRHICGIGERRCSISRRQSWKARYGDPAEHLGEALRAGADHSQCSLLDGDAAPLTPRDLLDACLRGHPPGSSDAAESEAQSLAQFCGTAVDREARGRWRPPADLRASIGAAVAPTPGGGDPFMIPRPGVDSRPLPIDVPGRPGPTALRLLAGVRDCGPVELQAPGGSAGKLGRRLN